MNDTLGWVYVRRDLASLGIPHLEDAVRAVPSHPGYRYHLGMAYLRSGAKGKARDELARALRLDERFPEAQSAREPLTPEEQALLENGTLKDYEIQARPRDYYRAMRKGDPIHYDKGLNSWLVTRHEDIWAVQSDPITFSVQHGYHEQQVDEPTRDREHEAAGHQPLAVARRALRTRPRRRGRLGRR